MRNLQGALPKSSNSPYKQLQPVNDNNRQAEIPLRYPRGHKLTQGEQIVALPARGLPWEQEHRKNGQGAPVRDQITGH